MKKRKTRVAPSDPAPRPFRALASIRQHLVTALALILFLAGGLGGWAATTKLSGALIAPGQLVVDTNVKKVQHPTGGVVGELRVRDGDHVKSGDILVRLDETVTRANLAIVVGSLDELYAKQARLQAERDGDAEVTFPASLLDKMSDPAVARLVSGEKSLFGLRAEARKGQQAQLRQRVDQLKEEIAGLSKQIVAKKSEIELIHTELKGVDELWKRQLVQIQRLSALQRDETRVQGELGQLEASVAQTKGRISEINLQIIQIDQDLRSEVAKELGEIQGKLAEFVERKITAEDQLKRIDIKSPQDGTVHQLATHTIGGVIAPGEPIMFIVPDSDELTVEAKINPQDIDQVRTGQRAVLRLSAFNQRTTPELNGVTTRVSADTTTDPRTGQSYYLIRISLPAEELRRLDDVRLMPGMPVEAFVQTGERTVLSYLIKPFQDQLSRTFREK
jgi:HlyD family secretion protein